MKRIVFLMMVLLLVSGCGYTRVPPPVDPNQTILQIMQQRTLGNTLKEMTQKKCPATPVARVKGCDELMFEYNFRCKPASLSEEEEGKTKGSFNYEW